MNSSKSNPETAVGRFWDRYIALVHNQGIKQPADRWHVKWAERYIERFEKTQKTGRRH